MPTFSQTLLTFMKNSRINLDFKINGHSIGCIKVMLMTKFCFHVKLVRCKLCRIGQEIYNANYRRKKKLKLKTKQSSQVFGYPVHQKWSTHEGN